MLDVSELADSRLPERDYRQENSLSERIRRLTGRLSGLEATGVAVDLKELVFQCEAIEKAVTDYHRWAEVYDGGLREVDERIG